MRKGYFVYDSKKAGGLTVSHLRQRKHIHSAYLIAQADFVGCHQLQFIDKYQMAKGTSKARRPSFCLIRRTAPTRSEWRLPQVQAVLLARSRKGAFYVVSAAKSPANVDLAYINTVMQMLSSTLTHILRAIAPRLSCRARLPKAANAAKVRTLVERNWLEHCGSLARESLAGSAVAGG